MSVSGRTDTRLKKTVDKTKKKVDELVRIGSSHSERIEEKITFKPIDGEDVQSLSIRDTELKKFINDKPKPTEKIDPVLVKKANPKAYPTTEVKVAKLVPNKPTKPIDYSDNLGMRFDKYGNCVPYSILGTVEDYLREAVANGKSIELPYDTLDSDRPSADRYLMEEEEEKEKNEPAVFSINNDGGEKALNNWQRRMKERKSVQDLVSNKSSSDIEIEAIEKSNRNASELVMNQYDVLNKKNHLANVLDRALPLVENGKGNRFGSEFWNQPFQIGDDNNGIFSTLTKSQQGVLPDLEQVDKPSLTFRETHFDSRQPNLKIYPWSKSKYLEQRLKKLEPIIDELMPHRVEFDDLQVKGINPYNNKKNNKVEEVEETRNRANEEEEDMANYTWVNPDIENKPPQNDQGGGFMNYEDDDVLASYEDVVEEPIFGPCLVFGGQTAHWTGGEPVNDGVVALESRLNFETKAGKRVLATFEIFNAGTCAMYYDWKKVKESNPFPFLNAYEQRFYFDTRPSVILPGDALKLHIVFKSNKGGIFTEKWELLTRPMLLSGASLILTLRGVALQEDKFKKRRISLEKNLFMREAEIISKSIVEMILQGVRTPRRSPSPIDNKLIEDQIFTTHNKSLPYDQETVDELKQLYDNLMSEDSELNKEEWNLSVNHLKQQMQKLEESDPVKCHEKLATLNSCLDKMSLKPDLPKNSMAYSLCYNLICSTFDEIFNELSSLKQSENVQLPISAEVYPVVDELEKKFEDWKKEFEVMKQLELERKNRLEKEKGGKGEKGKKAVEKKDEKKKEKKGTQSPAKSRNSRESALSRADSRAQVDKTLVEEKEIEPPVLTEAQIKRKELFSAKSYNNVYQILLRMFDYIEGIFESTIEQETISEKNLSSNKPIIPSYCDFID